jgi:endonuclease/exonuclease/phosphatase family metal-dependent hydrolase
MILRIATLNLEQNHKRWEARRALIAAELKKLQPDLCALNEIHLPSQTGRWLQQAVKNAGGTRYTLLQQAKAGDDGRAEAEGLLTRIPVIETASLDYRSHDCVALAARFEVQNRLLDVYVTHLIATRVPEAAREFQVGELLEWIGRRGDFAQSVICGDFNASPDQPSAKKMSKLFAPTQTAPTAFTPLREPNGAPTHSEWPRLDRCFDYIWIPKTMKLKASGLCFDRPAENDPDLWPSDHVGVWAEMEIG